MFAGLTVSESVEGVCASEGSTGDETVVDIPGCLETRSSSTALLHGFESRGLASVADPGSDGVSRIDGCTDVLEYSREVPPDRKDGSAKLTLDDLLEPEGERSSLVESPFRASSALDFLRAVGDTSTSSRY